MKYIRFIGQHTDYIPCGLFTVAQTCIKEHTTNEFEKKQIEDIFQWFNDNIPCPPYKDAKEQGLWGSNTFSWFKETAVECISKMWEFVYILEDVGGIKTEMIINENPGRILYDDQYQIVAEISVYDKLAYSNKEKSKANEVIIR